MGWSRTLKSVGAANVTVRTVRPKPSSTEIGVLVTLPASRRDATRPPIVTSCVRDPRSAVRSQVTIAATRDARRVSAENQLPRHPDGASSDVPVPRGAMSASCMSAPNCSVRIVD